MGTIGLISPTPQGRKENRHIINYLRQVINDQLQLISYVQTCLHIHVRITHTHTHTHTHIYIYTYCVFVLPTQFFPPISSYGARSQLSHICDHLVPLFPPPNTPLPSFTTTAPAASPPHPLPTTPFPVPHYKLTPLSRPSQHSPTPSTPSKCTFSFCIYRVA